MPTIPATELVDDAITVLDGVRREWLRRPGVTAVDVGYKISDGELTDDVALRVHVARKLPVAELAAAEVFNESGGTPTELEGFPIDVIEATYGPSDADGSVVLDNDDPESLEAVDRKSAVNPLIGGVSCGNTRVTAGTLGVVVYDRATCQPMILSNWHVLAGASAARVGESIVQPGSIDGGTQTVATLTRMRLDSAMDAAVATLNGARGHNRDILGLGTVSGTETAHLGMLVVKSGRTTAITRGIVDGVSMSVSINYGDPGVVAFSNQIRIVPRPPWPAVDYEVSKGGDSGSIWLNQANNRAIGLHFAGENDPSPASENAIANPIGPVAQALNFSFLPVLCPRKPFVPFDLCMRYPWLCKEFRWDDWFRPPIPDPPFDVPPIPPFRLVDGPVLPPIAGPLGSGLTGPLAGRGLQSAPASESTSAAHADGDCGCGRSIDHRELADVIAAYLEGRRR